MTNRPYLSHPGDAETIYSRIPEQRQFQEFPQVELDKLVAVIEAEVPALNLANRLNNYFSRLNELHPEPELTAMIGHAIVSYLAYCVETGQPWAAQFLFPPALDPKRDSVEGGSGPAVDQFQEDHLRRNFSQAIEKVHDLVFQNTILFIHGPMFSAKSGAAALIYGLLHKGIGQENLLPVIFEGMGEDSIHARSLRNGKIPAMQMGMDALRTFVGDLIANPKEGSRLDQKRVVIIEEATFFELEDQTVADEFAQLMNTLQENGISVIIIGLDKNYRGAELMVTQALMDNCTQMQTLNCTSYHLHPTPNGNAVSEAEFTGRYSTTLEMFDWCFPILVPRALAAGIEYNPLPGAYHPLQVLQNFDPELFERLNSIQRADLLAAHTELTISKEV